MLRTLPLGGHLIGGSIGSPTGLFVVCLGLQADRNYEDSVIRWAPQVLLQVTEIR